MNRIWAQSSVGKGDLDRLFAVVILQLQLLSYQIEFKLRCIINLCGYHHSSVTSANDLAETVHCWTINLEHTKREAN